MLVSCQFEPEVIVNKKGYMRSTESDGDGAIQDFDYRVGNLNWYKCEHCRSEERRMTVYVAARFNISVTRKIFYGKKVLINKLVNVHLLKTPKGFVK